MSAFVGIAFISSVVAELAAVTHSSMKLSNLAFLAPRILNSDVIALASTVDYHFQRAAKEEIRETIQNYNLKLFPHSSKFEDLKNVEESLIQEYEKTYNKLLFYVPENLYNFFKEIKRVRDFENLKTILACIKHGFSIEKSLSLFGPQGVMTNETLESLAKEDSIKEALQKASPFFPPETFSKIDFQEKNLQSIQYDLDRAAVNHISVTCEKANIHSAKEARDLLIRTYEIKDIVTIARLKQYRTPDSIIIPLLIDEQSKLTEKEFENLRSADNYKTFYNLLAKTSYGSDLPTDSIVKPSELEELLRHSFFTELTKAADIGEELVIQFMIGLKYYFPTIWKAIVFSSIETEEKR